MLRARIHPLRLSGVFVAVLSTAAAFVVAPSAQPGVRAPRGDGSSEGPRDRPDFAAARAEGLRRSAYLTEAGAPSEAVTPKGTRDTYRNELEPLLRAACYRCHGPEKQKGSVRIDTLDPDLAGGDDADWWVDVLEVVANGDMPPAGEEALADADRARIVEWLTAELHAAATARRAAQEHSPFRRLSRYEYSHMLQDLLGLPNEFGDELPPDPISEAGFENSADVLHLSTSQLQAYLESNRAALREAAALGPRPEPLYWSVSMDAAAAAEWPRLSRQLEELRKRHAEAPETLAAEVAAQLARNARRPGGVHFEDRSNQRAEGRFVGATWGYDGAKRAFAPSSEPPGPLADATCVAVLPADGGLIVELGDRLPERGWMRVRVRAARASAEDTRPVSLRLLFGWQASNDSNAVFPVSEADIAVDAPPDAPEDYTFDIPMCRATPRNLARGVNRMGDLPSPSEYIKLLNASLAGRALHIHHVEVIAPLVEVWPPESHTRLFPKGTETIDEDLRAQELLEAFMARAWRRPASADEVARKVQLFRSLRAEFGTFEEALIEVFAVVLTSPNFLYVASQTPEGAPDAALDAHALATRLALFLWCSSPDEGLLAHANKGTLQRPEVLAAEVDRMLADPRARRLSRTFVGQWLDLGLMEKLRVDRKVYPGFDDRLRAALVEEPVAFFDELLRRDASVLELVHSDFTMVDERLAAHYGIQGVTGNEFRPVTLDPALGRGGLLVQAGPLAMNSDGTDSHPLKRGVWLLKHILDDPPPPPPPAVPTIDLADPEVLKMTLKERIEDHRNDPACHSCHAKIDPWGIAFEEFDAVGRRRTQAGGRPVDAASALPSGQVLDGADGLKAFLLANRQDQLVRALTQKLATFALGRPLGLGDRAHLDRIAREARRNGDGLATLVKAIATSDLFRSP